MAERKLVIPQSLTFLALKEGLSAGQVEELVKMNDQIIHPRTPPDKVDWRKFYEAVKEFLVP